MKQLILCAVLAFANLAIWNAHADIEGAPYLPEIDARFNAIEQGNHFLNNSYPSGAADGHYVQQEAQATYNFATQTGATGNYDLGVSIPANAIITRTYAYSITKPTTSASGTLGFYCNNNNNPELKASTVVASYGATGGAPVDGIQSGAAANMSVIPTKCDVHATIGTGSLTAGKVTLYINYVVHQ